MKKPNFKEKLNQFINKEDETGRNAQAESISSEEMTDEAAQRKPVSFAKFASPDYQPMSWEEASGESSGRQDSSYTGDSYSSAQSSYPGSTQDSSYNGNTSGSAYGSNGSGSYPYGNDYAQSSYPGSTQDSGSYGNASDSSYNGNTSGSAYGSPAGNSSPQPYSFSDVSSEQDPPVYQRPERKQAPTGDGDRKNGRKAGDRKEGSGRKSSGKRRGLFGRKQADKAEDSAENRDTDSEETGSRRSRDPDARGRRRSDRGQDAESRRRSGRTEDSSGRRRSRQTEEAGSRRSGQTEERGRRGSRNAGPDAVYDEYPSGGERRRRTAAGIGSQRRSAGRAAAMDPENRSGRKPPRTGNGGSKKNSGTGKGSSKKSKSKGGRGLAISPRILLVILAIVAALVVVVLLVTRSGSSADSTEETTAVATPGKAYFSEEDVLHLSFPSLLVGAEWRQEGSEAMTTDEFRQILQDLYDKGYVLVDYYDVVNENITVTSAEDGEDTDDQDSKRAENTEDGEEQEPVVLPAGKKPLLLSQRNVNYPLESIGSGYASRLLLDDSGNITAELKQQDGSVTTGAYDVVPILEEFLQEHPDFSYNNARMVLALSGCEGVLGYRTVDYFGVSSEEGNPYGGYGVFDTEAETESAREVIQALKEKGYRFASNGFGNFSYGSSEELLEEDASQWQTYISPLVDGTDILFLPDDTDIGSWSGYTDDNAKFTYLKGCGFSNYCIQEESNRTWLQIGTDYVREGFHKVNTLSTYQSLMEQFPDSGTDKASDQITAADGASIDTNTDAAATATPEAAETDAAGSTDAAAGAGDAAETDPTTGTDGSTDAESTDAEAV